MDIFPDVVIRWVTLVCFCSSISDMSEPHSLPAAATEQQVVMSAGFSAYLNLNATSTSGVPPYVNVSPSPVVPVNAVAPPVPLVGRISRWDQTPTDYVPNVSEAGSKTRWVKILPDSSQKSFSIPRHDDSRAERDTGGYTQRSRSSRRQQDSPRTEYERNRSPPRDRSRHSLGHSGRRSRSRSPPDSVSRSRDERSQSQPRIEHRRSWASSDGDSTGERRSRVSEGRRQSREDTFFSLEAAHGWHSSGTVLYESRDRRSHSPRALDPSPDRRSQADARRNASSEKRAPRHARQDDVHRFDRNRWTDHGRGRRRYFSSFVRFRGSSSSRRKRGSFQSRSGENENE